MSEKNSKYSKKFDKLTFNNCFLKVKCRNYGGMSANSRLI